ncbi:MAG TPA: aldehyde dehydrogenase family protein [Solirubrobacteraceae bacterium]|jgi:acyl-CoA reductase-like NAD-dependent aldehyde dehydrogenase|nr:aldehyde dehydrogenase family protein [Solirubrobacteraceae bacterium]
MSTNTASTMTIAGEAVAGEQTFDVINPATGASFAQAPECTREQLDEAFRAAEEAQRSWRTDESARRAALKAAAARLGESVDELASLLVAEQGKPLRDAKAEIKGVSYWLSYFADLELPREIIQDDARAIVEVVRRPVGVVAAITPWNFPLLLAAWKIGPALLAGNTVVIKPSPYTPLSTLAMVGIIAADLPAGVLGAVSGGDELGAWMTSHPIPRKVSFTGSVATGKHVAASAAPDLKRVTLELGGNDAAIVLDDVDPGTVAAGLFAGAFSNAGQVCSAVKRVYVPERLYQPLLEALAAQAGQVVVGDGMSPDTTMGPINNRPQFDRVSELTAAALADGARAVAGGGPLDGDGYFFAPTILDGALDGMRIVDEEQFGPVLPVIPYRDERDALERANATSFGLSGSVWSEDPDRAQALAEQLECGTAWINTHLALAPHQPFGGMKWSGIGVENGRWGLLGFTELQVVHRAKPRT